MNADKVPEDSVLRRHYETHLKMTGASGGGRSTPHSASRSATASAPAQSSGGGFMGWLKRLFGG